MKRNVVYHIVSCPVLIELQNYNKLKHKLHFIYTRKDLSVTNATLEKIKADIYIHIDIA